MENCESSSNGVHFPPNLQARMEERSSNFPPLRLDERHPLFAANKLEERTSFGIPKHDERPLEYNTVKPETESPPHFAHRMDDRFSMFPFHRFAEGSATYGAPKLDERALDFTPSRPADVPMNFGQNSNESSKFHESEESSKFAESSSPKYPEEGNSQQFSDPANTEQENINKYTDPSTSPKFSEKPDSPKFVPPKMDGEMEEECPKEEPELSNDSGTHPLSDVKTVEEPVDTKPKLAELDTKLREESSNNAGEFVKVETNENEIIFCRLCANPTPTGVNMLHPDGLEMNLIEKLTKSMPMRISSDDPLPKTVCYTCLDKFDFCFNFMEQVYRGHRTMVQQLVLGSANTDDDKLDKTMEGFIHNSAFFKKTFNTVKYEETYSEPYFGYPDELYEEEEEEKPRKKKKRGRKPKGSKDESKEGFPKVAKSKKLRKMRGAARLKLRFVPSLTTCADCGEKSESCKDNLEHWNRAHAGLPVAYK